MPKDRRKTMKTNRESDMTHSIEVRFLGAFKKAYGKGQMSVQLKGEKKLAALIHEIAGTSSELRRVLLDPELEDPRPNAVILVNGKEISVLNGLETKVANHDEIVFIPVIHGG